MSCWIRLGIDPTHDLDAIRLAYRSQLPAHHPETDPQGFQALREAYEEALRHAREAQTAAPAEEADPAPGDNTLHPALKAFHALLEDPHVRFSPEAWQGYIGQLDELPLEELEDVSWQLLHTLRDCGPISHNCANLLARRLGWADQLLRLENPQAVEAFLQRLEEPDPFDTALMSAWPPTAQMETLWYARTLGYCYDQRPLFEYKQFAQTHTCLALPDDDAFVQRLLVQFSQAGIGSKTLHARVLEQQRQAPDDVDLLYLLARQCDALGLEEQALQCWLRLWREQRHPQAAGWLIDLCARHQPQRLPLLIQALDQQTAPASWPEGLDDPAQAWGSPAQSPETLARWSAVARLELGGIADTFIDWRLDGDDELPLLARLLEEQDDRPLQHRYWQAWALQRGEAGLLRLILAEQASEDALDALILEGFQRQAEQQLHWLEHAPIVQALVRYSTSDAPAAALPEALSEDDALPVCREWLRRMRCYCTQTLRGLNLAFNPLRMFPVPFALSLQGSLAEDEVLLPPMPEGQALWNWHRQNLFMLALADQPERWLALISPHLLAQLHYPPEHPFAALHDLLLQSQGNPEGTHGLLDRLDPHDPLQKFVASRLLTLRHAINGARLPGAAQLLACLENNGSELDNSPLGYMLLCAVLYHDPSLDSEQQARLRVRIDALSNDSAWFEPLREGLLKGKTKHLPRDVLEQQQGIDSRLFNEALDTLDCLVRFGVAPRTRFLRLLQRGKDDPNQDAGLRCALMALLSWSERLLLAQAQQPAAPAWAFWKLRSRLNRKAFALHLLAVVGLGALHTVPVALVAMGVLLLSALLRRIRDLGHGVPALIILLLVSRIIPVLPLALLGLPGDALPNRYGPAPGNADALREGLQAALRRLDSQ
ncbi:molecular chaperone DnaJ [Pseudomonas sp. X10]